VRSGDRSGPLGWGGGDAQQDLDVPAGDADFLDEYPQELLFLDGVELVDHAADPFGEVVGVPLIVNVIHDLVSRPMG
jgi:hypothetical protein